MVSGTTRCSWARARRSTCRIQIELLGSQTLKCCLADIPEPTLDRTLTIALAVVRLAAVQLLLESWYGWHGILGTVGLSQMTQAALGNTGYEGLDCQVSWQGTTMAHGVAFDSFLTNDVVSRLHDLEGANEFETTLRSLANTGFANENIDKILAADIPEERDWAIGEAIAEAYLTLHHDVTWPWNMERDKRTAKASLPGADLIGFETRNGAVSLVLGEVKTSSDPNAPPGVMNGRGGMQHQLSKLASDLGLISTLLKWLLSRCKGTHHETSFREAITRFLESGNRAIVLFGVLIRDTPSNELDLRARANSLAGMLNEPSTCKLIALYIPCSIAELPKRIAGSGS